MDQTESLPVLYIRAKSHYDVGHTIGTTFKGWIKDYLDTSNDVKQYKKFYSCDEGGQIVQQYLSTSRKHYPNIMSEILGMADGAAVNFEDLFLLQLSSEIEFCHLNEILGDQKSNQVGKGCTDVLVNRKQCRVIGHNDDWTDDVSSRVYIVHVTIADESDHVTEQFVSFSYPGYLTGFCFGMNQSLVISLNSLSPKRANKMGVPLAILLRSLFAYNSIEECSNVIESKPYGCAYGMTINIASINGTEMCSMEVYPQEGKSEVNIKTIPYEGDKPHEKCYYYHQNFYKNILAEESGPCTGSRLRDKRANQMTSPNTIDDVKAILGDTEDDVEPIYRVPCASHNAPDVKTVATAIFNISERQLYVYRRNPTLCRVPCLTLPFL